MTWGGCALIGEHDLSTHYCTPHTPLLANIKLGQVTCFHKKLPHTQVALGIGASKVTHSS